MFNKKYFITSKMLKKVVDNSITASRIGDEMYLSFVNERLIKGKVDFSEQFEKVSFDIELRKRKRFGKQFQLWKKIGKGFGVMLGKEVNLIDTFWYPATSVSLNLAFLHSTITQNPKHHFRNHLIDVSKTCESTRPNEARWMTETSSLKPLSIDYLKDVYWGISDKSCTTDERGHSETRVHLQSLEYKMLFNKEWLSFVHNIKNKQHLFSLFLTYLCGESMWPILVNNENETFKVSSSVKKVFDCNHEESDTTMIFHGLQQKTNVWVC